MASTFSLRANIDGSGATIIQSTSTFSGMKVIRSAMSCCGITTIQGFGAFRLNDFEDKANLLECLYQNNRSARQYLFVVNKSQRGAELYSQKDPTFALFEEIGAKQIHIADNHNMGTKKSLAFYILDIQNALGKYLNRDGTAMKKPPPKVPVADMLEAVTKATAKRARKPNGQFATGGVVMNTTAAPVTASGLMEALLGQAGISAEVTPTPKS